jgi:colanic acid biosynthesis glycosyl transferase WcaI
MKVLVVSQYFAPENFRVNDLVAGLVQRGHEVVVLTGQPNYPSGDFASGYGWRGPRREQLLGAQVVRVPLVRRAQGSGIRLALNYLSFAFTASMAALLRLRGPFDAIVVFETSPVTVGIPAAVARWRFGAPILFWVLDVWPDSLVATGAIKHPLLLSGVARLVRWIYACCSLVLVQSKAFPELITCHGFPSDRIRYFPNWVEPEYEAVLPYGPARCASQPLTLVYAGNIGAAQGFGLWLDALAQLESKGVATRWRIAGDGRAAEGVKDELSRRGLSHRVEWLGQLPPDQMPALFAQADALYVALQADPLFARTIPGKVQSYLAAGRPVLAMLDGEGARAVEDAEAGLVCAAGDVTTLVDNVIKLNDMSAGQREAMGRTGRAYALREFSRNRLFDQLEGWLTEATQEAKRK